MSALTLHGLHQELGARFGEVDGAEVAEDYGDWLAEHRALQHQAALVDLCFRSRLWVRGSQRLKFLNGQITNEVGSLQSGYGCYSALTDPKGRMQSDLNLHSFPEAVLLDFEPGRTSTVRERLQRYVLGSGVQLVDASGDLGLLSVQGPRSAEVLNLAQPGMELPRQPRQLLGCDLPGVGRAWVANLPRLGTLGFDLWVAPAALPRLATRLLEGVRSVGGGPCGWKALETARVEAGIPRFGADMDETNLPPEAGIEDHAVSYSKGCYVGQETLARLQSRGQVARALRGLRLAEDLPALPMRGTRLFHQGRDVGHLTSATWSPRFRGNLALGYVRREVNHAGTQLALRMPGSDSPATVVSLPDWE